MVSTMPVVGFLLYWPFIPESVRWLSTQNRHSEAVKETERLVHWNMGDRRALDLKTFVRHANDESDTSRKESLLDMFKEARLLGRLDWAAKLQSGFFQQ